MRKKYITHPRFQINFSLAFVSGTLLIIFIQTTLAVATLLFMSRQSSLYTAQQTVLLQGARTLGFQIGIFSLIAIIFFLLIGLYLSYKFVGPLYRLENWLEQVLQQNRREVLTLRPGDELEPVLRALKDVLDQHHMKEPQ